MCTSPEWRQGKPISPRGVARILSKFDIRPTKQAFANCYRKSGFEDAWRRYLPISLLANVAASSTSSTNLKNTSEISELDAGQSSGISSTDGGHLEDAKWSQSPVFSPFMEDVEDSGRPTDETKHPNGHGEMF